MAILVVPVSPDQTDLLTLGEWEALKDASPVLFERADHPLSQRLRAAGVAASALDAGADPSVDGGALVAEPDSPRVLELARRGASVSIAPARAPDALTAAHAARVARRAAASLASLAAIMARLRSVDGCPWDREQSHESLRVHLVEETHEVLDAIDGGLLGADLQEELGDVLLQVAFHAQLAAEDGRFDMAGVADAIVAKLVRRHPHVFGEVEASTADEVVRNWEAMKEAELRRSDPLEGIPASLPALLAAFKMQKRAARAGFEAGEDEALRRIREALESAAGSERSDREAHGVGGALESAAGSERSDPEGEGVGEALFWTVALARARGVDPEGALKRTTRKFADSFRELL